jgi:hypothetical protein
MPCRDPPTYEITQLLSNWFQGSFARCYAARSPPRGVKVTNASSFIMGTPRVGAKC